MYSPETGDPERQPVKAVPFWAGEVAPGAAEFGAAWLWGAAFCSGALPGVAWLGVPGVCGEAPGVCGVVSGVCGAVLGVEVCELPVACPLCWLEVEPDGAVLFGVVVWAATQTAESSNMENNGAFNFMAVSTLQIMSIIRNCRRGRGVIGIRWKL
jgi:hypothetical protein